ncbi:glycoside hydrolase family 28 protein [Gelatoporia subvermispora B]|uniref:endo-polygalacturonase n=1 Tax=Ceriporiopsis subvermispora (strain B) TaxID=914234 RepID=M2QXT1_CERS8|nr:glycoside hydrolase family 28 protein [Gelatoporia subvermispora B]
MLSAFATLSVFAILAVQAIPSPAATPCTGTIASLDDVDDAVKCTTVEIMSFTVPAGETFDLKLEDGTTVNMMGDVAFGNMTWEGPLFEISGDNVVFNGNGHTFDGGGPFYWDGQGGNGGVTKPAPMMKIEISGTFTNVRVLNSPERVYSVSNPGPLTMSNLTVDNSAGNAPNSKSDGQPAGHNTDGFDVSTTDLVIEDSTVINQDDCLAINKGSNIVFQRNTCMGGHGISVAIRIKTDATATDASVTNVTYSGNTASQLRMFGVLIDQSYPDTLKTPGNGVQISDINFVGAENTFSVDSDADRIAVNCGVGSCTGTWDWSALTVTGGSAGPINNFTGIEGFSQ